MFHLPIHEQPKGKLSGLTSLALPPVSLFRLDSDLDQNLRGSFTHLFTTFGARKQ
jgi:hypothetical protein